MDGPSAAHFPNWSGRSCAAAGNVNRAAKHVKLATKIALTIRFEGGIVSILDGGILLWVPGGSQLGARTQQRLLLVVGQAVHILQVARNAAVNPVRHALALISLLEQL